MNAQDVVVVATVTNPLEAEMMANMLSGEGIAATVEGAGQADIVGNTEVRILVRAWDASRARKALQAEREVGESANRSLKAAVATSSAATGTHVTHAPSPRSRRYGKGAS